MELTPERFPQAMEQARMRHQIRMQTARSLAAEALERLIPVLEERAREASSAGALDKLVARIQEIERVPVPELHLHSHQHSGAGVHDAPEPLPWEAEVVDVEAESGDGHAGNGKP